MRILHKFTQISLYGEGTTLDEFNKFLSENGCETIKTSGEE